MNRLNYKKIVKVLLVIIGAIALISEIGATNKNYYIQSIGIVCLMSGVFLVNTSLSSRSVASEEEVEKEQEEV